MSSIMFYSFNDNWRVGFQAVNIANEIVRKSAIIGNDLLQAPRGWHMNDSRYSVILRAGF
jgi:hypothetical protein